MHGIPTLRETPRVPVVLPAVVWDSGDNGDGGMGMMVAAEAFLTRLTSLIVDAPSLPDCAIEAELGDKVPGELGRSVSTCMGLGRCSFFTLTSFSGSGGGTSDTFIFAVLVEAVERTEATDWLFRGGVFASGAGLETFLDREVAACDVVDTAEVVESRRGRVLEGVVDTVDLKLAVERSEAPDCFLILGTVSLDVEADNSERALLKDVSDLVVADETDLVSSVAPSLLSLFDIVAEDNRGLVTVTKEGAFNDFTETVEVDEIVLKVEAEVVT